MTVTSEDLLTTAQDQFLAAVQGMQSAVLEGVKLWSGAVDNRVPTALIKSVPGLDTLPTPATYAALRLDFAEQLLAYQREFIEQLLAATDPATDTVTPAPRAVIVPSATKATVK